MPQPSAAVDRSYANLILAAKAAGDPLRADILRVLETDSFGVLELCHVLETSQPALSHHLKVLLNAGLVTNRREANHVYYRRVLVEPTNPLGRFLDGFYAALDQYPRPAILAKRIEDVHQRRATSSRQFFRDRAADFPEQQALIAEPKVYRAAALELLDGITSQRGAVLEVGPGVGDLLVPLAQRFREVVAVDDTPAMLKRAVAATRSVDNVRLLERRFQTLPRIRKYDAVIASMVIHHNPSPHGFFVHAESVLRPGGALLVIELCSHDQEWVREACGDIWLGFTETELDDWAESSKLEPLAAQYLAQKNGFRIQLRAYLRRADHEPGPNQRMQPRSSNARL